MESSSHQRFDKPTAPSMDGSCRLRHKLNSDCLLKIFEYLNVMDLIQLSKLDSYFFDLIASEFIAKNVIDLGLLDKKMPNNRIVLRRSTIESFKLFGKFLKKIVIRGDDFNLFLRTITEYCIPQRLTAINLQFCLDSASPATNLIDQSMPFFSELRRMRLADISNNGLYQLFLKKISESAKNLAILNLFQVDINGGWLQQMQHLSQIHIHAARKISFDDLSSCFEVNTKLKTFAYRGNDDLSPVYHNLSVCCPGLKTFSDYHLSNPYYPKGDVTKRYQFLSKFKNLDNVTLTSYTESGHDLNHHLTMPALANISKLRVCTSWEKRIVLSEQKKAQIMESFATPFDNLKIVQIAIQCVGEINCNLRCEYVFKLVSQLKNIENVQLIGRGFTNVDSILRHTDKIQRLCIGETDFRCEHFASEMRKIQRVMRKIVIRHPIEGNFTKRVLHLNVNYQQWKYLQAVQKHCGEEPIRITCNMHDKNKIVSW